MSKTQKVALVTGAGRGIGRATAIYLAKRGDQVFVNDYNSAQLEEVLEVASEMDLEITPLPFDISDENQVEKAFGNFIQLDYLVNNASICPHVSDEEITSFLWNQILSINVKGTYFCSNQAAERMKRSGTGSIVNVSSGASKTGGAYVSIPYAASKAAINSLTFSFAKKLAPYGIRVNAVAPGFIDTQILRTMPIAEEQIKNEIPLGRIGKVDDVASCIGFLLSNQSSFITGEIIDVNGGDLMD